MSATTSDAEFDMAIKSVVAAVAAASTSTSDEGNRHNRSFSSPISETSDCHSDSDIALLSFDGLSLAERLTSQRWHEIGNGPPPIAATSDFDEIVDQLSSVLAFRLRELLIFRVVAMRNKAMKRMNTANSAFSNNCNHNSTSGEGDSLASATSSALDFLTVDPHLGDYVLSDSISESVRNFVATIGKLHNGVGFHSFEHATHVTLSMNKLLSMVTTVEDLNSCSKRRISSQDTGGAYSRRGSSDSTASEPGLYDRQRAERISFGISEDPRLRFAMVFSALIHDVAHTGVPNSVLVEEEDELAILHNDVSVAEQHSLQVAFSLLQREEFQELKRSIGPTSEERKLFRKTVIGMVMVTDISDQERLQIVASRWKAAFPPIAEEEEDYDEDTADGGAAEATSAEELLKKKKKNALRVRRTSHDVRELVSHELKQAVERRRFSMISNATAKEYASERHSQRLGIRHSMDLSGMLIDAYPVTHQLQQHAVLDAIMNAADVAHTMQSFQVFVKWNRRLFKELYCAHLADRVKFDPSQNWYENQIGFFSHYILPLTQKLKQSGVFGSTGTVFEYFALENKRRWELEGEDISEVLIREVKEEIRLEQEKERENIQ
mmetsp:Transcript_13328/g.28181  ORF Transcript_13328/g.28181 Transcript_13328/m.28181 type:complete len:607 (+) Transcript_13328:776-2596(+)|eukprot:CAMPEP_0171336218 /NCGR_PEP_ID=MMETSP0878-20121228/5878_1 /TAXON_ID=67004 /ORGANISM="Thalassiosira weissflogii, Strain CCMP1336" /LENGTH=606 /DNA_ID=CAMNT_0011837637 /DNA_START=662 /DNA_END=2482 /DNA_ORIENTATION=+